MFSLAKILLPIDFSERCLPVARYAIPLAEHFHSELTLLHVLSSIDEVTPEARALNENRRKTAAKALDDFLCAALNHLKTRRLVREGDAAEVIAAQAVEDGSDLIMMPTHGYSPFRRLLLGCVFEGFARHRVRRVERSARCTRASRRMDRAGPYCVCGRLRPA